MTPTRTASQWRGWSGRLYPCTPRELDAAAVADAGPSVLIAVKRDDKAVVQIVDITLYAKAGKDWTSRARAAGAAELRTIALTADEDGAAIVADLDPNERRGRR